MPTPRPLLLLIAGLSLTLLTVGLPLVHLRVRPSGAALALAALPLVALLASTAWPRARWLTHLVFPASHLPLLLTQPELTSREVYGGLAGLVGLIAIAVAFGLFLTAATPSAPAPPRTASASWTAHPTLWRLLALVFAAGPTLALALPALTMPDPDPLGAAVAVGSGVAIALLAGGSWMPRLVLIRDEARPAALARLATKSRPSGARGGWLLGLAALTLAGLAAWSHWRP